MHEKRTFLEKTCKHCKKTYLPTGSSSKYCSLECRKDSYSDLGLFKQWRDKFNLKQGVSVGVGSGSLTGTWKDNPNYSYGRHSFINHGRKMKNSGGCCNRCSKDLTNVTRGEWCSHHKDHNRKNNTPDNLELLCKSCHQKHHKGELTL